MTLYIIGIGLNDEKDITLKGLEAIRKCDKIYLEAYTSLLNCNVSALEELYGKKIIVSDRDLVEKEAEDTILKDAEQNDVAFLVVGDAMAATTHTDIFLRAVKKNIDVNIINNASVMNAIANIGLELYKFGKTTSIVFPEKNFAPESCYDMIKQNKSIEAHTLCLLDIKKDLEKYMTVNEAIQVLLDIEKKREEKVFTLDTFVVGVARIGSSGCVIKAGKAKDLLTFDYGKPLHCLVVPSKLHFKEEEMLELWK